MTGRTSKLFWLLSLLLVAVVHAQNGGLDIEVVHKPEECPIQSQNGDKLSMHYSGFLTNGDKFDSSRDRGTPFDFVIGRSQVIQVSTRGDTVSSTFVKRCIATERPRLRLARPDYPFLNDSTGLGEGPSGHVHRREAQADHPAGARLRIPGYGTHPGFVDAHL